MMGLIDGNINALKL